MKYIIFAIALVLAAPAHSLSPKSIEQWVRKFYPLTGITEKTYNDISDAYRARGFDGLREILQQNTLIRDDSARGILYIRLAVEHKFDLETDEAIGIIEKLHDVRGFSETSRLLLTDYRNEKGALQELRIADRAVEHNFTVECIRCSFQSENLKGTSDIDIILKRDGQRIAIESKNYAMPARIADINTKIETLQNYLAKHVDTIPCFVFSSVPSDSVIKLFETKGIYWVSGDPALARFCGKRKTSG